MFAPGALLEVSLLYHGGDKGLFDKSKAVLVFKGVVTRHTLSATREKVQLVVEARHKAVAMTTDRKNFVWIKPSQTDREIITKLFKNAGITAKFRPGLQYSVQDEMVQYYCTDWDFVLTRCQANGFIVVPGPKGVQISPMDDKQPDKEEFEIVEDQIIDFDFEVTNDYQYATVNGSALDPKTGKPVTASAAQKGAKGKQGVLQPGPISSKTGGKEFILNSTYASRPELTRWAFGMQTKAKLSMLKGRLSVRGTPKLEVGQVVKFSGLGKKFSGQTMITGIRHRANIGTWRTDIQFGGPGDWHAHKPEVMERPASGLLPGTNGLQIGIVQDYEADKKGLVRAKVLVPNLAKGQSKGFLWARLGSMYAGDKTPGGQPRGMVFWPEKNTEVILGFFNDDPRYPVILGQLWGKPAQMPLKPAKNNPFKGIVSAKGMMLKYDDKKEIISLDTKKISLMIDQKANKFTIDDKANKNKIVLDSKGILLDSAKDIQLKSKGGLKIKAGKPMEIDAPKVKTK